jgi:UDP-2,3-diacylglucosamine pyrophosphatase LpxH
MVRAGMAHFIVGDGHFVGRSEEGPRWARLLRQAHERGAREVSILGDLFELWLGLAGLEQSWQRAIFEPLFALKRVGVKLRYVVGNKDYFVEEWNAREHLFEQVWDPGGSLDSPIGPLHLAHGDLVNTRDRQYRAWRRVSRSRPFAWLVSRAPRRWTGALASRVARGMQNTNRYHKSYFPETELRRCARELPQGPATLVYGHFHVHKELTEGDKRVITLPFLGADYAGILVSGVGYEVLSS